MIASADSTGLIKKGVGARQPPGSRLIGHNNTTNLGRVGVKSEWPRRQSGALHGCFSCSSAACLGYFISLPGCVDTFFRARGSQTKSHVHDKGYNGWTDDT
jgi:hypothetical protein